MHLVYPPKFCKTIVSAFCWVSQSSQEKLKTMVIQTCGVIVVLLALYGLSENSESALKSSQIIIVILN